MRVNFLKNEERVGPPKFSSVSLHTCHALERPRQTLGNLTLYGSSVLASGSSTPSPSALLDLTRLYQASESAVFLTAYVMPSYASIVSFDDRLTSSTTATLGMSG